MSMKPHTVGDATQGSDRTLRRLRVICLCIVGYVGLWDVTATFGPQGDLARRGGVHCNVVSSRDGKFLSDNDRCQSQAVARR
jgi:hypothetical protein